jgi:hypothetical protein
MAWVVPVTCEEPHSEAGLHQRAVRVAWPPLGRSRALRQERWEVPRARRSLTWLLKPDGMRFDTSHGREARQPTTRSEKPAAYHSGGLDRNDRCKSPSPGG